MVDKLVLKRVSRGRYTPLATDARYPMIYPTGEPVTLTEGEAEHTFEGRLILHAALGQRLKDITPRRP